MLALMSAPPRTRPISKWRAQLALFFVSLIWGATFVWMKQASNAASAHLGPDSVIAGAALFLGVRFGVAALIVVVISRTARSSFERAHAVPAWRAGLWLGFLLLFGFGLQMRGLADVTPAVSAFLTSLYVIFTALLAALKSRRGLRVSLAAGAVLATFGAGLVRGRPEMHFTFGEWLTVASAFAFAAHILATDRLTRVIEPMQVTLTSFVVVAVGNLGVFAVCMLRDDALTWERVTGLLCAREFLVPLALTTLLATVVALSLMNLFQRDLDPVRAAILYAFEPIFALFFGLAAGLEILTPWLWIGGGMILLGNLVAEIGGVRAARRIAASSLAPPPK
jgi:drug/metabolite transporter (DMT)-like permease